MNKFDLVWVLIIALVIGFVVLISSRLLFFKYLKLKRAKRLTKFTRHKRFWIIGFVSTLLAIPIIAYVFNFKSIPISGSADHWGQMGDFFGGMLNPVLAFSSFMALLYTIRIQSKQLDVSTKELKETRTEIAASRAAQELSSEALAGQLDNAKIQLSLDLFYKMTADLESFRDREMPQCTRVIYEQHIQSIKTGETTSQLVEEMLDDRVVIPGAINSFVELVRYLDRSSIPCDYIDFCYIKLKISVWEDLAFLLACKFNKNDENTNLEYYGINLHEIIKQRKLLSQAKLIENQSYEITLKCITGVSIPINLFGFDISDFEKK